MNIALKFWYTQSYSKVSGYLIIPEIFQFVKGGITEVSKM